MTTWLLGNAPAPLVMLNRAPEEMSGVGTEETIARAGGPSACWGKADALAQPQDRRR
jgi:hypothetical protein